MNTKSIIEDAGFHLLPKAIRRFLVHSEDFFFKETGARHEEDADSADETDNLAPGKAIA